MCADAQGVHASAHQWSDCGVDQPVALKLRTTCKCARNQLDGEVTPLACARMPHVLRAVVDDLQRQG